MDEWMDEWVDLAFVDYQVFGRAVKLPSLDQRPRLP